MLHMRMTFMMTFTVTAGKGLGQEPGPEELVRPLLALRR